MRYYGCMLINVEITEARAVHRTLVCPPCGAGWEVKLLPGVKVLPVCPHCGREARLPGGRPSRGRAA
jgi:hypothetical protein